MSVNRTAQNLLRLWLKFSAADRFDDATCNSDRHFDDATCNLDCCFDAAASAEGERAA